MNTVTKAFSKQTSRRILTQPLFRGSKQSWKLEATCNRPFHSFLGNALYRREDRQSNISGLIAFDPVLYTFSSSTGASFQKLHTSTRNYTSDRNLSTMDGDTRKAQESAKENKHNVSSPVSSNTPDSKTGTEKAMTKGRGLVQKYGYTFVATYLGVYVVTLGALFTGLDSGLIDPMSITNIELPWHTTGADEGANATTDKEDFDSAVDFVVSYMKKFPWTAPYTDVVMKNPHMANLGLAWVATKLTEPIRLPISIGIVRKLKKED